MVSEADADWLSHETAHVLYDAANGDRLAAARRIARICARHGYDGAYGACCCLAEAIIGMGGMRRELAPGQMWGFRLHESDSPYELGEQANPDGVPEARPIVQAMRFLTAYANRDYVQCQALMAAVTSREEMALVPGGLILIASGFGPLGLAAWMARVEDGEGPHRR